MVVNTEIDTTEMQTNTYLSTCLRSNPTHIDPLHYSILQLQSTKSSEEIKQGNEMESGREELLWVGDQRC
jgi:hypothetical protein